LDVCNRAVLLFLLLMLMLMLMLMRHLQGRCWRL
jgi:hypothetical protein